MGTPIDSIDAAGWLEAPAIPDNPDSVPGGTEKVCSFRCPGNENCKLSRGRPRPGAD
jgi:hypothetical protein